MAQQVWTPQINSLAEEFEVLVYDMWGHGKSVLPAGQLALSQYAQQLVDLLDRMGIPKAHVVGHSMGALVALEFALDHPSRCHSVVAMSAVFLRTQDQSEMVQKRADELLRQGVQANLDDTMKRWFGSPVYPGCEAAEKLSRRMLQEVNQQGYARAYKVFATADAQQALRLNQLKPPALFFTGELDPNSTPAMSHAMVKLVPHGEVNVLAGHRHMMSLTAPDEVSLILREAFTNFTEQVL